MVSMTYKPINEPVITEVYADRNELSFKLGIDPRTLGGWLTDGRVKYEEYVLRSGEVINDVMLSSDVRIRGSNRGCPKGENRFIKNN